MRGELDRMEGRERVERSARVDQERSERGRERGVRGCAREE